MKYKTLRRLPALLCLLTIGWAMAACSSSDDPTPEIVETVTATFSKSEADVNSITFTISTQYAETCAWMQLHDGSEMPSAEKVMNTGTKLNVKNGQASVTVEELTPETKYTFVAAARSANGTLSEVCRLEITTLPMGSSVITLNRTLAATYADVDGKGNYTVMFASGDLDETGAPVRVGDLLLQLNIFAAQDSDPQNATLPNGTYLAGKQEVNTFNPSYTYVMIRTAEGEDGITTTPIAGGEITVNRDGDLYTIDINGTLMTGESIQAQYKGALPFTYAGSNHYERFTETQDVTFDRQSGRYWGNFFYPHSDDFALQFVNGTVDENGTLTDGYYLYITAYMPKLPDYNVEDPALAEGTYHICNQKSLSISYIPYDIVQGKLISVFESDQVTGSYLIRIDGKTGKQYRALLDKGSMKVTRSGNSYTLEFDFLAPDGVALKGTYKGEIHMHNYNDNDTNQNNIKHPWSTLTDNVSLHFNEAANGKIYYMGEYMKKGYNSWIINILNDEPYKDDYITLELMTPVTDGANLKEGDYVVSNDLEGYQLIPGFWTYGGGDVAYCWYGDMNTLDEEGYSAKLAPINGGKMTLKKNKEEDTSTGRTGNYTFTFDFVDDNNHTIKGSWTGEVNYYNATPSETAARTRGMKAVSRKTMKRASRLLKIWK